jgi:hypothetical protein
MLVLPTACRAWWTWLTKEGSGGQPGTSYLFPQIKVPEYLTWFFGLALAGTNGGPAIAQAVGWIAITIVPRRGRDLCSTRAFQEELPTFADIHDQAGNVVGFTTIYYDNFLSACRCEATARLLHARRTTNIELPANDPSGEGFGLRIKPDSFHFLGPDEMSDPTQSLNYLGVATWQLCQPRRGNNRPGEFVGVSPRTRLRLFVV